ncbi:MAG: hypothetical protein CMJ68_24010 [Planctomycetaceae bacterium]|nr:hypothetical protein [Planctomycetaceae bacterium]
MGLGVGRDEAEAGLRGFAVAEIEGEVVGGFFRFDPFLDRSREKISCRVRELSVEREFESRAVIFEGL